MHGCPERKPGQGLLRREGGRGEAGILLLEALIGLAIISMVAISLLAATGSQVRSASKAGALLTAAALAQDRLAALQLLDVESFSRPPDSLLAGTFPVPFEDFAWTAQVEEAEGEYDLYAVSITVEGRGEWFPLETFLHRPPLTADVAAGGGLGGGGMRGGEGMGGRGGRGGRGERSASDRRDAMRERLARVMGRGQSYRRDSGRAGTSRGQGTGRPPPTGSGTGRPPPTGPGSGQPPPGGEEPGSANGTGSGPSPEGGRAA